MWAGDGEELIVNFGGYRSHLDWLSASENGISLIPLGPNKLDALATAGRA